MFFEEEISRQNYQLRFQEMENKIKKCELERTNLEQRFEQLMRERQECEKAAARSMKQKYRRMMELERQRAERNDSLLRMLHKIDQQAASLAAKSDRLKMLKTQYETYLMRTWSSPRALPPQSPVPSQIYTPAPSSHFYQPSFPHRSTDSPKSEFVRYLSDMTHAQTSIHNPIPPPTALSNYIASGQYEYPPTKTLPSHSPFPYESSFVKDLPAVPSTSIQSSLELPIPPTPSRRRPAQPEKLQLSNEEFIQYIDNEILKGETSVEIPQAASPLPDITVEPPTLTSTPLPAAYLEDIPSESPPPNYADDTPFVVEQLEKLTVQPEMDRLTVPAVVENDAAINQRWERVVQSNTLPSKVVEEVVEQQLEVSSVSANLEAEPKQEVVVQEATYENSAVSEETPLEYQQTYVSEEVTYDQPLNNVDQQETPIDYQQTYVAEGDYQYPTEAPYTVEDTAQAPLEYGYENYPTEQQPQQSEEAYTADQQVEDPNYWDTAREAVKSKTLSRTPETIEEVLDNGALPVEQPVQEKRSTPSMSKRSSPMGENVSISEVHYSRPDSVQAVAELVQPEPDPTQYDYSQYPQEYDQSAEYQYPQEGTDDQQQQYYQQYPEQDPNQPQAYQEYAEADPNQYQKATEYPGPTQYVFEQSGYYDQQQQQDAQYDPNQQAAYYDPNAIGGEQQQQYYGGGEEQSQQAGEQSYYDQTQTQDYANYEAVEPAAVAAEPGGQEVEEEQVVSVESSKVEQVGEEEQTPTLLFASSTEESAEKVDEQKQPVEGKLEITGEEKPIEKKVSVGEEKNDATISSANDESDFDFSTQ